MLLVLTAAGKNLMSTMKIAALAVAGALSLSACSETAGGKETAGTLLGAAGGALLGSQVGGGSGQIFAAIGGGLLGAYLGNQVGQSLDNADRAAMKQSAQYSLEATKVGHTSNWSNPDSGNSGTITPTNTYQAPSGEYCREYQQTVTIGGETQQAYGTACRQPDGSWRIAN